MMLGMMVTVKRSGGQCFDEIVLGLLLGRTGKQQSGRNATILQLLLLRLLPRRSSTSFVNGSTVEESPRH